MKKLTSSRLALAVLALTAFGGFRAEAQDKKRVAVLDFEYQTVHEYVYYVFGSDVDIGKGIANMLVTDLVRNGTYTVIARGAVGTRQPLLPALPGRAAASTRWAPNDPRPALARRASVHAPAGAVTRLSAPPSAALPKATGTPPR